ncbi:MAG TPA: phosphoribosylglycinamide synthetase C domain-containing protein, partial [Symbiobacteriaceae bacterium]|nr:phosphoribosylglycinamide synthetase C domain-containing protein [Symbiobacteriaceae bacterium]
APVPFYTPEIAEQVQATILEPLVKVMAERGAPFAGCLFAGLMLTPSGPKVVEFNARFGDPEAEVVLPLLKSDLLEALVACAEGRLDQVAIEFWSASCACIMLASGGYPGPYEKGLSIEGLAEADDRGVTVFHAGTWVAEDGEIVTNGGRVVGVMAGGPDLESALERAYWGVDAVSFLGKTYRRDIGWQALQK